MPIIIDLVLNLLLHFFRDTIVKEKNAFGNKLLKTGFLHSVVFQTNFIYLKSAFINVVTCLLYITYSK